MKAGESLKVFEGLLLGKGKELGELRLAEGGGCAAEGRSE